MPEMSLEEQALRHADEFFMGPGKWERTDWCGFGPGDSLCVGRAIERALCNERAYISAYFIQPSAADIIRRPLGIDAFAEWNDKTLPNFAALKAHLRTRIEYYTKKRLSQSYLVIIGPGRQVRV